MESLLTSPRLIDFILAFTVIEAAVLILGVRRMTRPHASRETKRSDWFVAVALTLLPGICLLLAVRAALVGAPWPWVPASLSAALVAHLLDLRMRWRR